MEDWLRDPRKEINGGEGIRMDWIRDRMKLIFFVLVVSVMSGTLALCYRLLLEYAQELLQDLIAVLLQSPRNVLLWVSALILLAWLVHRIVKWNPGLSGGGISQMMEVYRHKLPNCWWKNVIGNITGGTLSLFSGLSIGTESPVIQLAASIGNGISGNIRSAIPFRRALMGIGAAVGFTVGFSAPISGLLFTRTVLRKRLTAFYFPALLFSVFLGYALVVRMYGFTPYFDLPAVPGFSLRGFLLIFCFALVLAVSGMFYNAVLVRTQFAFDRLEGVSSFALLLPVFLLSGLLAFTVPQTLGSGEYIYRILNQELPVRFLLLLLVLKFVYSMLSPTCGVPGGLMYPLLMLGAVIGKIFGDLASAWGYLPPEQSSALILYGMCGIFIAGVRKFFLGVALVLEMTWQWECLPGFLLTGAVCRFVPDLMKTEGIYEALADRIYARHLRSRHGSLPPPRNLAEAHLILNHEKSS